MKFEPWHAWVITIHFIGESGVSSCPCLPEFHSDALDAIRNIRKSLHHKLVPRVCSDHGGHCNHFVPEASGSIELQKWHPAPAWASCAVVLGQCATLCKVRSIIYVCNPIDLTHPQVSHTPSQTGSQNTALLSHCVRAVASSSSLGVWM